MDAHYPDFDARLSLVLDDIELHEAHHAQAWELFQGSAAETRGMKHAGSYMVLHELFAFGGQLAGAQDTFYSLFRIMSLLVGNHLPHRLAAEKFTDEAQTLAFSHGAVGYEQSYEFFKQNPALLRSFGADARSYAAQSLESVLERQ